MLNKTQQEIETWFNQVIPSEIKWREGEGKTNCPFSSHGSKDRHPSFTVNSHKGTWYCHKEQKGGGIKELAQLLNAESPWSKEKENRLYSPKNITEYNYVDAEGRLLFQTVRQSNPKKFYQRQPKEAGGWLHNLKGVDRVLFRLPNLLSAIERRETIYIVEGEKDVLNLEKQGLTATSNPMGAGKWLEKYSEFFPSGTEVVIIADNDEPGRNHAKQVSESLHRRGCNVKVLSLPNLDEHGDVSDWLERGNTVKDLLELVKVCPTIGQPVELKKESVPEEESDIYKEWRNLLPQKDYLIDKKGNLCKTRMTKDGGTETVMLANFVAKIVRQVEHDDGQTNSLLMEIDGILAGGRKLPPVIVPAAKLTSLSWLVENWGAAANTAPGTGTKDSIRYAIQNTALYCEYERLYTHTGWRQINGKWAYLHGNGAVGADNVSVKLDPRLAAYSLPKQSIDTKTAALNALNILDVAPREVTLPLFAMVFLAPLCEFMRQVEYEPTFMLWVSGMSGARKSTLAALFLSFFGKFVGKHMPASFKDTENAIERRAFILKDSLLCVDDYHPVGSQLEKKNMEKKASALIRGYGDRVGRGRLNADLSERETFYPRGLCIITGEDIPNFSQSSLARLLSVELKQGAVNLELLTEVQKQSHYLSETMVNYLLWLAPRTDEWMAAFKERWRDLRNRATQGNEHGRLPEIIAFLQIGVVTAFEFLMEIGAVSEERKELELENAWSLFIELIARQSRQINDESPAEKFVTGLRELLATGKAVAPSIKNSGIHERQIGWHDEQFYYLYPSTTYKAICEFFQSQGSPFELTENTLWKHLEAKGMIVVKKESGQTRRTPAKRIHGKKDRYVHLRIDVLNVEDAIAGDLGDSEAG